MNNNPRPVAPIGYPFAAEASPSVDGATSTAPTVPTSLSPTVPPSMSHAGAAATTPKQNQPAPSTIYQGMPIPEQPLLHFGKAEWAIVLFALIEAILWMLVFEPGDIISYRLTPGIGTTVFTVVVLGCALTLIGKKARYDRVTVGLLAATVLLGLAPTLYGNETLRMLNGLILVGTGSLALFLTADLWPEYRLGLAACSKTLVHTITSMFTNWTLPFKALRTLRKGGTEGLANPGTRKGLVAGFAVAGVLLVFFVLPLLASADAVFGSLFDRILDYLYSLNISEVVWRIGMVVAACPVLFGLLWATVRQQNRDLSEKEAPDSTSLHMGQGIPVPTTLVVLAVLNVVYLVFVVVQFVYLFGGNETAAMHGGYAEYARSGFFQLVAIAVLNVALGLLAIQSAHTHQDLDGKGAVFAARTLVGVLVVFTGIILVSACMRMLLYIDVFGLSMLRLFTLLGMALIAVVLVALLVKLARNATNFFAVCITGSLVLWIGFMYSNPDALIANYNVDHYMSGDLSQVDAAYLGELSSDALPALYNLEEYLVAHPDLANDPAHAYEDRYEEYWFIDGEPITPTLLEEVRSSIETREKSATWEDGTPWQLWWRGLQRELP